ncbi:MAG: hypothetical protein ACYCQJ_02980 [Nitrososphaerales archaeon]
MSKSESETIDEFVIDTSAFFSKASRLRSFVEEGKTKLSTLDLVVFEFTKLMQVEIRKASQKKSKRLEVLKSIRDRFPELLTTLGIEIKSPQFALDDLAKLYDLVGQGQDAGDCMIWLKMQKAGLDSIITQNTSHWKKLGAKTVPL